MRKLYEIFKILQIQKRIVSAETIHRNTVLDFFIPERETPQPVLP